MRITLPYLLPSQSTQHKLTNIFDVDLSNITDIDTFLQTPLNVLQYNIDTTILVTLTDTILFNGNEFVWSVDTNVH